MVLKEIISFIYPGDYELIGLSIFGKENADGIEFKLKYFEFIQTSVFMRI